MWEGARRRQTGAGADFAAETLGSFTFILVMAQAICPLMAWAGPYAGPPYYAGDMVAWASQIHSIVRGPIDISDPQAPLASHGLSGDALGMADTVVVSLGDGGQITLDFDEPVGNGPGDDFAVFENGFLEEGTDALFAEFAFVEVSSNGTDFARFAAVTLHDKPVFMLATIDPTDFDNLAGDQPRLFGTGFDLAELTSHPLVNAGLLDLQAIDHVRLIDVVGDGSTQDSLMNAIYDPFTTAYNTGGFDADAVGVINLPEPGPMVGFFAGLAALITLARRRRRQAARELALVAVFALTSPGLAQADYIVDFEDQGLSVGEFDNGAGLTGGFVSRGVQFENQFTDFGGGFSGWTGFSSSAVQDTTTPGFGNQYAAYGLDGAILGSGAGDSTSYGVFFDGAQRMLLPTESTVLSAYLTNNTYAGLSMTHGDSFAKKFGGATGSDPDFFTLTITGYDAGNTVTGSIDFDLADFRFIDDSLDYIVDAWTLVDLSSLGSVKSLGFTFSGSDMGQYGLNTPAYVAIDDITVIPEPGTALLVGLGLLGLARQRRRAVRI